MAAPTEESEEKIGKIKTEEEGSDLQFRKLPAELLELIISNLPTEEAGSWIYQWKYVSHVQQEEEAESEISNNKSQDFYVNDLLTQLIHVSIKSACRSHYGYLVLKNGHNWMKYTVAYLLNEYGIEEVAIKYGGSIGFSDDELKILDGCLDWYLDDFLDDGDGVSDGGNDHLRKLQLQGYCISNQNLLSPFGNLGTLKLCRVTFIGKAKLGNIILGCVLLENLIIEDCLGLNICFKIGNDMTRMKRLEINRCVLLNFNIHVDTLKFLSLHSSTNFSWHSCVIQCPNLMDLQIYCGSISCRFPLPYDHMHPINQVLHFPNLTVLRTTMDLNRVRHNLILRDFFRECTKLQEVDIFNDVDKDDNGTDYIPEEASIWRREFFESITYNLRSFRIKGFSGQEREMRLVDYLITSAMKLKKLVIQFDTVTSQGEEGIICKLKEQVVKREVLSLARACLDVSIIFDSF